MSGWIALVASGGLLGSQLIVGVISFTNQNYVPQRWHQFLIYIGYNLVAFLLNAFGNSLLPYVTKGAFAWSITGFVIISITVLACSSPNYASGKFVFTAFINGTQTLMWCHVVPSLPLSSFDFWDITPVARVFSLFQVCPIVRLYFVALRSSFGSDCAQTLAGQMGSGGFLDSCKQALGLQDLTPSRT